MAEIDLYQDDGDDGVDDDDLEIYGGLGSFTPDIELSPLQKLQKHIDEDNIFSRSCLARTIMDTLHSLEDSTESLQIVMDAVTKLGFDKAPPVRAELMEQIPHVTMYLVRIEQHDYVRDVVVPLIQRALSESNNQVRKTSQAALLVLLEQELLDLALLEEDICPVIQELAGADNLDDFRTEAVALMSKMAPLIGHELTERLILADFARMCSDSLFHVRKVCASNFGELCSVVGLELTEEILLPRFFTLCDDGVWGVRKACAECFMAVSVVCSAPTRRQHLAPIFVTLLGDASRWVRMAAFQALGPFISTFAEPTRTGFCLNEEGALCLADCGPLQVPTNSPCQKPRDQRASAESPDKQTDSETADEQTADTPADTQTDTQTDTPTEESRVTGQQDMDTSDDSGDTSQHGDASEKSVEELRADRYKEQTNTEQTQQHKEEDSTREDQETERLSAGVKRQRAPPPSLAELVQSVITPPPSPSPQDDEQSSDYTPASQSADGTQSHVSGDVADDVTSATDSLTAPEEHATGDFSSFMFWRDPLPAVDLDDLDHVADTAVDKRTARDETEDLVKELEDAMREADEPADTSDIHVLVTETDSGPAVRAESSDTWLTNSNSNIMSEPLMYSADCTKQFGSLDDEPTPPQDMIPEELLTAYLSMNEAQRAHTVDTEIVRHCAYSLPAVVYTLGRTNWLCVRGLFHKLCASMQWKVRRCIASSLHELSLMLGADVTNTDLLPVFDCLLRDIDEVRIAIVQHLADFLKLLGEKQRRCYLSQLKELVQRLDNNNNWRFRYEFIQQLIGLCDVYSARDLYEHVVPLAFEMSQDKVYSVRQICYELLARLVQVLSSDNELSDSLVSQLVSEYAKSTSWTNRHGFVHTCGYLLPQAAEVAPRAFNKLIEPLIQLSQDPISNIRLAFVKLVADLFNICDEDTRTTVHQRVQLLEMDSSPEIRHIAEQSAL